MTALIQAVRANDEEKVANLLKDAPYPSLELDWNYGDAYGVSTEEAMPIAGIPLHVAVFNSHPSMVQRLLQSGADPNIADLSDKCALDIVCFHPNFFENKEHLLQIMDLLLDAAAKSRNAVIDLSTLLSVEVTVRNAEAFQLHRDLLRRIHTQGLLSEFLANVQQGAVRAAENFLNRVWEIDYRGRTVHPNSAMLFSVSIKDPRFQGKNLALLQKAAHMNSDMRAMFQRNGLQLSSGVIATEESQDCELLWYYAVPFISTTVAGPHRVFDNYPR